MDIYTYFTPNQMRCLLIDAKYGTARMLKGIKKAYPNDYKLLIEAIADCMPQLVAEDRLYKQGPRKGQRKIVFWDNTNDISSRVAQELTGCATTQEFVRAYSYCDPHGGTGKTMVETVLAPPVNSEQYAKHWIKTFLDDKAAGFPNLKPHYHNQVVKTMHRAHKAVDAWLKANPQDIQELMTWDSNKFNTWHFAQRNLETA